MKIGIVLQARMASTRLPGKVLALLSGKSMLWHIVSRLRRSKRATALVIATTSSQEDTAIQKFAQNEGIEIFRGNEHDLLDRYYQAAKAFRLDHIVRCTADNPLVDYSMLDSLIDLHVESGADLTHSKTDKGNSLPVGAGAEVYTLSALEQSWREAVSPHHREHVDEYIHEHSDTFRILNLPVPKRLSYPGLRLTVDTDEDYKRMTELYESLYVADTPIELEDAINWCIHRGW